MNTCSYFVSSCVKYYSLSPANQDFKHRQAEIDRQMFAIWALSFLLLFTYLKSHQLLILLQLRNSTKTSSLLKEKYCCSTYSKHHRETGMLLSHLTDVCLCYLYHEKEKATVGRITPLTVLPLGNSSLMQNHISHSEEQESFSQHVPVPSVPLSCRSNAQSPLLCH